MQKNDSKYSRTKHTQLIIITCYYESNRIKSLNERNTLHNPSAFVEQGNYCYHLNFFNVKMITSGALQNSFTKNITRKCKQNAMAHNEFHLV